jgi:hypothetical protein
VRPGRPAGLSRGRELLHGGECPWGHVFVSEKNAVTALGRGERVAGRPDRRGAFCYQCRSECDVCALKRIMIVKGSSPAAALGAVGARTAPAASLRPRRFVNDDTHLPGASESPDGAARDGAGRARRAASKNAGGAAEPPRAPVGGRVRRTLPIRASVDGPSAVSRRCRPRPPMRFATVRHCLRAGSLNIPKRTPRE